MLNLNFDVKNDLYKEIKNYDKRIYVWGTGSVAAGVIRTLEQKNIKIDGCFTNVTNYNVDPRIQDVKIYCFDELISSSQEFSVVMGHSHYELAKSLNEYDNIENIWSLAMIVRPDISMRDSFINSHISDFNYTYSKLSDIESKENMQNYLNVQLTKNGDYIVNNFNKNCSYFDNDVINIDNNERYIDIGAYDGSSIDEFIAMSNNKYEQILALEVMKNMYLQLKNKYNDSRINVINTGISDHNGYDYFCFNDQSTCLSNINNGERVLVRKIDDVCDEYNMHPSLMKICIGNTVLPILEGATKAISHLPKMVITAGIDNYALIKYIPKIEQLAGEDKYEYYLRYTSAMAECLILIAKPKEKMKKFK